MKQEVLAIIHSIIIIFAWLSPFWLDWKISLIIFIIYYLQLWLFNGCILANLQFEGNIKKKSKMTMTAFWLERFGFKVNRKMLNTFSEKIIPPLVIIIAIIWQLILNMPIIIKL